jgi:antirestriction protein
MLAYLSAFDSDADIEKFEEVYYGKADSERQFAEDFAFESGLVCDDSPLLGYIDWQAYWDGELRRSFMYEDGYVFNRNW